MKKTLAFFLTLSISPCIFANEKLETRYWDCDYKSTIQFIPLEEGAECGIIYEKLLKEKFKGSFQDFMKWWKENKDKEYLLRKKLN